MLKLLALTMVLCAPLSPQSDQVRVVDLLKGATVVQTWHVEGLPVARTQISTVLDLGADGCSTWLMIQPRNDHVTRLVIDWARRNRRVSKDGLYVSLVFPARERHPSTVSFLFPTTAAADEATAAFERLGAACAPQP